jgi:hypothetical protein
MAENQIESDCDGRFLDFLSRNRICYCFFNPRVGKWQVQHYTNLDTHDTLVQITAIGTHRYLVIVMKID